MPTTGRRTTVKPGKYGTPWSHDAQVTLAATATHSWGQRDFDLLVDGVKIGEVEAQDTIRQRPNPTMSGVSSNHRVTEWSTWAVDSTTGKRQGRYTSEVSTSRYASVQNVVRDYLRERGAL